MLNTTARCGAEQYMFSTAEFDDQRACLTAIAVLNKNEKKLQVTAACVPKATVEAQPIVSAPKE